MAFDPAPDLDPSARSPPPPFIFPFPFEFEFELFPDSPFAIEFEFTLEPPPELELPPPALPIRADSLASTPNPIGAGRRNPPPDTPLLLSFPFEGRFTFPFPGPALDFRLISDPEL